MLMHRGVEVSFGMASEEEEERDVPKCLGVRLVIFEWRNERGVAMRREEQGLMEIKRLPMETTNLRCRRQLGRDMEDGESQCNMGELYVVLSFCCRQSLS